MCGAAIAIACHSSVVRSANLSTLLWTANAGSVTGALLSFLCGRLTAGLGFTRLVLGCRRDLRWSYAIPREAEIDLGSR